MTSCIDLMHEITINKDKSGEVFIGFESMALGGLINIDNQYVDEELKKLIINFPIKALNKLKEIEGISKLKAHTQLKTGRIGIQFHFNNPKTLNKAYYALGQMDKKWFYPQIVKINKHRIKIRNITPFVLKKIEEKDKSLLNNELANYVNIKTIIHLPSEVKPTSIKKGKLNKKGTTLTYVIPLKKFINNESYGNRLKF